MKQEASPDRAGSESQSPIGPLAYLHFKDSLRDEDPDNTFYLSSVGVIPPLREKDIKTNVSTSR
jgi:hypothetical protein